MILDVHMFDEHVSFSHLPRLYGVDLLSLFSMLSWIVIYALAGPLAVFALLCFHSPSMTMTVSCGELEYLCFARCFVYSSLSLCVMENPFAEYHIL
ncbi:hypothetical protein BJX65DRAFT_207764 [Aspergillus insuetus]